MGVRVEGLGVGVWGLGFSVWEVGSGSGLEGFRFVLPGFCFQGLGFRICSDLGLLGFRVQSFRIPIEQHLDVGVLCCFGVSGSGLSVARVYHQHKLET